MLAARIALGHVVQVLQFICDRLGINQTDGAERARGSKWQGG